MGMADIEYIGDGDLIFFQAKLQHVMRVPCQK